MGQQESTPVSLTSNPCFRLGISLAVLLAVVPALARAVDDFTIAIFGDSQHQVDLLQHGDYDPNNNQYPDPDPNTIDPNDPNTAPLQFPDAYDAFTKMIDWLTDPCNPEPVQLVLHVGDATEHDGLPNPPSNTTIGEWKLFNAQWKRLDAVPLPYVIARGNHDHEPAFKQHYGDPNVPHEDASAAIVTLGGQQVLAMALALPCAPWDSQMAWAQAQLDANPDKPAVVVSHMITNPDGYHVENPATATGPDSPIDAGGNACPNMKWMELNEPNNPLIDPNRSPKDLWADLVLPHADQVFLTASGHFTTGCKEMKDDGKHCRTRKDPRYGFKAIRDPNGQVILDTLQNWQGRHTWTAEDPPHKGRHKGFMTLVRFKNQSDPNSATVEVLSWDAVSGVDPTDPNDPGFSFLATDPNHPRGYYEGYTWLPEQPFWFNINRDSDGDGKLDPLDNCPHIANPNQEDDDQDSIGNVCDGCPSYTQSDRHQTISSNPPDGIPDECRCGDTSREGGHDGTDVVMNQDCFLGLASDCDPAIADTDNNGEIDGTDVLEVQNAFLGLTDACDLICERSGDPNTPDTRPACNP